MLPDDFFCQKFTKNANVEVRSDIFQNFYYSQEDYALVSLCSFGNSQKLTKCNSFEKVAFAFGKEKCFTFNGSTSSSEHHQRKVGPNNGLNYKICFITTCKWIHISLCTLPFRLVLYFISTVKKSFSLFQYIKME